MIQRLFYDISLILGKLYHIPNCNLEKTRTIPGSLGK